MKLAKTFKELCTPAMIYFVIATISILLALLNHVKLTIVLFKALFVIFWTFVLNYLCKKGFKSVSWFLVLFPFIVIITAFLLTSMREGMEPTMPTLKKDDDKKPSSVTSPPAGTTNK